MQVAIKCIDKTIFEGMADEVILPGLYGKVGIRSNHAPMSVILTAGDICVKSAAHHEIFQVIEGIAHVSDNFLNILLTD